MEGESEALEVFGAGDLDCAEAGRDGGEHLNVEEEEITLAQVLDKVVESDFGSVAGAVEHGFAREEAADSNAINAADELIILPAFEAVSVALFVQLNVGFEKLASDPGGAATRTGRSTAFHDFAESTIDSDLEYAFANNFGEAMGDVEVIEFKNGAGFG